MRFVLDCPAKGPTDPLAPRLQPRTCSWDVSQTTISGGDYGYEEIHQESAGQEARSGQEARKKGYPDCDECTRWSGWRIQGCSLPYKFKAGVGCANLIAATDGATVSLESLGLPPRRTRESSIL